MLYLAWAHNDRKGHKSHLEHLLHQTEETVKFASQSYSTTWRGFPTKYPREFWAQEAQREPLNKLTNMIHELIHREAIFSRQGNNFTTFIRLGQFLGEVSSANVPWMCFFTSAVWRHSRGNCRETRKKRESSFPNKVLHFKPINNPHIGFSSTFSNGQSASGAMIMIFFEETPHNYLCTSI